MLYLLSRTGYLIIGIGVIILLIALFFIGYILNKKTPIPEECKNLVDEEKCSGCANKLCSHYHEKEENKAIEVVLETKETGEK